MANKPDLFPVDQIDRALYEEELLPLLPQQIWDVHTHCWVESSYPRVSDPRMVSWTSKVASENPIEDLFATYRLLFPKNQVKPLIFANVVPEKDLDRENAYVEEVAGKNQCPSLLFTSPNWTAQEVEDKVIKGRHVGIKVYLSLASSSLAMDDITIYDFLPPNQLEVMDHHNWIVMLHIPRSKRLADPANLRQLQEIDQRYPHAQVIVAHMGRAYCPEDVGDGFNQLRKTSNLLFDFSANTNAFVFEQMLTHFDASRILFGSDLPITRMRMYRICEQGKYINVVPQGLYGDISGDSHMRDQPDEDSRWITFFLYEELLAFKQAAIAARISESAIRDVFYFNCERILEKAGWNAVL
jgi:uncharacterized protein